MQLDMHYHGTYVLARMSGFSAKDAKTIATAAQFVDEAVLAEPVNLGGSGYLLPVVSAHKTLELMKNNDLMDQWRVWVPFHFLPGGQGDLVRERLICLWGEKDNKAAEAVIDLALASRNESYGLHMLGIVTHVLQDTYAHYGFSGIASDFNLIEQGTLEATNAGNLKQYIESKRRTFLGRFFGGMAEATKLGHASVATYPDRPYLDWEFDYTTNPAIAVDYNLEVRRNQVSFYRACTRLHALYDAYLNGQPAITTDDGHLSFSPDEARKIRGILGEPGKKEERCSLWREKMDGELFNIDESGEFTEFDNEGWEFKIIGGDGEGKDTDAYNFNKAAFIYRDKVIGEILPALKILV